MGTPSAEHHECVYDLLCRLQEEGRPWPPPPPQITAMLSPSPSPSPSHGGAPCTTSEARRRTPAWAGAIRGFSNTLCLVIWMYLAPMAMRATNKEGLFICFGIFLTSFAFPVLGYVFTWDQP